MGPKAKQRYEKFRALGKVRFVLFVGVLMYGIPTMLIAQGLHYVFEPKEAHSLATFFVDLYPSKLIVWPLAGVIFGLWMWRSGTPARTE